MDLTALYLWCSVLYLVQAQNETSDVSSCNSVFRDVDSNKTINITEWCNKNSCITKCCPANQIIYNQTCVDNTHLHLRYKLSTPVDYSKNKIYDKNIKRDYSFDESSKKMSHFKQIYREGFLDTSFNVQLLQVPQNDIYVLEDGRLVVTQINYYQRIYLNLPTEDFCVDFEIAPKSVPTEPELVIRLTNCPSEIGNNSDTKNQVTAYAMLVSSFFLVLVLAVYALLPQLQNLAGMMLMAYVATFTTAFIFRAVQVFGTIYGPLRKITCINIGLLQYYTIVASFTWMNVMSFDIWWSMRGFRKLRDIHRRGILVKFGWYSLYGWGAPLVSVLFLVIVDLLDLTHLPNFVKPHIVFGNTCFMPEEERQLYMNGPILITTCINITLFLMTAYNIWRVRRGVTHGAEDSRRNKKDEIRFLVYLKLSLVMGIPWILEVVSSVYKSDSAWWYIPDLINALVGLFMFIIFVCKRSVIGPLCQRFSIENELVRKWQPAESTRTRSTRIDKKRKILDSFTDTSDFEECEKRVNTEVMRK